MDFFLYVGIYAYVYVKCVLTDISLHPKQTKSYIPIVLHLPPPKKKTIRGIRTPISLLCRNNYMIISHGLATACKPSNMFHQHYPLGNKELLFVTLQLTLKLETSEICDTCFFQSFIAFSIQESQLTMIYWCLHFMVREIWLYGSSCSVSVQVNHVEAKH